MTSPTIANPLLQIQFQIPFDQIRAENVEPAIAELLADARAELDRLIATAHGATLTARPGPQGGLNIQVTFRPNA